MSSNEVALLVVYEYAESANMIIEHVGTLHVVVVLELQVNTGIVPFFIAIRPIMRRKVIMQWYSEKRITNGSETL